MDVFFWRGEMVRAWDYLKREIAVSKLITKTSSVE